MEDGICWSEDAVERLNVKHVKGSDGRRLKRSIKDMFKVGEVVSREYDLEPYIGMKY